MPDTKERFRKRASRLDYVARILSAREDDMLWRDRFRYLAEVAIYGQEMAECLRTSAMDHKLHPEASALLARTDDLPARNFLFLAKGAVRYLQERDPNLRLPSEAAAAAHLAQLYRKSSEHGPISRQWSAIADTPEPPTTKYGRTRTFRRA